MRLLLQKTNKLTVLRTGSELLSRIRITKPDDPDTDPTFEMHRILYSQQVYQLEISQITLGIKNLPGFCSLLRFLLIFLKF